MKSTNRRGVWIAAITILFAASLSAQAVNDEFSTMSAWTPGAGTWRLEGERLVQASTSENMARIDRRVDQSRPFTVEFSIRYEDGGFRSDADLSRGHFHGGFGIHLGVENPAIGSRSWGSGNSYLLWVNLDTRPQVAGSAPEHSGLRLQVYRSETNSRMSLAKDSRLSSSTAGRYTTDERISLDYEALLADLGIEIGPREIAELLANEAVIRLEVDPRTATITATIPGLPQATRFSLPDPSVLAGDYVSLRTNKLAVSYGYFRVSY